MAKELISGYILAATDNANLRLRAIRDQVLRDCGKNADISVNGGAPSVLGSYQKALCKTTQGITERFSEQI